MDILKYKIFLSVAERGSYSKVCADYSYTQSGISKMIMNMEDEIGVPLIVRTSQGISLTNEAKAMLPHIRKLVDDMDAMEEKLDEIKELQNGIVKVGSFPSISFSYMPVVLKAFSERYPQIRVEIIEEHNIMLLEQWLTQGVIDIGLFSRRQGYSCDWIPLKKEPFVAILPAGHRLAKENIVSVDSLFKEKLVLFKPHDGEDPDIAFLQKYYDKYDYPTYTVNSDQTITNMLVQNDFVTIFPEMIAKQAVAKYDVVYRPLDDYTEREIGIAMRPKKRISPAGRKFVDCIRHFF